MRLSVRTQLFVVLTVLTSVPALWLGLNAARTQSDRALASDQSAGVATARTVVRETQRIFTQFTQVTESLAAHAVQLRPWVSATLQGHVDAHLSHHDGFAVMYVADATGRSIVTSPELGSDGQPNAGVDYSSRDYFVGARDTLRTSLSRVQIGKKTGVPNVQIGAPLIGAAGEFLGIAEGSVKLDGLQQLVHGIANNLSMTRIVIVDDQAHVVADSAQTTIDTLGSVADQSVFERPERGVQYRVAVDEKSVLTRATVLRAQVQGKPWTVVVMRPDSVVVAVAEHARSQTVQAVALATVMGLLFAALLSAVLAAPIARLAQVADEVAGGATRSTFPAVAPWHPREMAGLKRALSGMLTALDSQAEELEVAVAERTRELEEANQRLAMLAISVENAAEAIQIIAADGQVQYVNPAFTRMTGYALEELDSVGAQGFGLVATGHGAGVVVPNPDPLASAAWSGTRVSTKKSGESYDEELTFSVLRDEEAGKISHYICIRRDITERKRAEMALRAKEMSVLRSANEKLVAAAKAQSDFIATVNHELRTPLNAVLGLSEVLQEGLYGELNLEQGDALETIMQSGQHLLSLINDLLDLQKFDHGHVPLNMEPVLAEAVADASMALARNTVKGKQIAFETTVVDPSVYVLADGRRLKQILVNLLGNAVKFTPDGGRVSLAVKDSDDPNMVDFVVSDTGIGIAQEDLESVFAPFFQVEGALARNYQGTGLGLALVARFVDKHRGRVAVDSEVGKGTQFTVSIPRSSASSIQEVRPKALRAVVISADGALERLFGLLGATVHLHPGDEGVLSFIEALAPDVVAIDAPTIGGDASGLAASLKMHTATRDIPLLFSPSGPDDAEAGSAADLKLTKPLRLEDMRAAVTLLQKPEPQEESHVGDLILIIEDNPVNLPHLVDFLQFKGFQVEVATHGKEGIDMTRALRPDVVLTDIQMPGLSGFDVIEAIRMDSALDTVKLVAVTALATATDEKRCMDLGANGYVTKPLRLSELLKVIRGLLQRSV